MVENKEVKVNAENKAETLAQPAKKEVKNNKKKANKKPNIFVRFGRKCKEVFSELKKVSWPTFLTVMKNTGVVLAVVGVFVVLITLFDTGLYEGIKALVTKG